MPERAHNTPWRQGHLLPDEAIEALNLHYSGKAETVVIVASHSCDILQNPDIEPYVEVIIGRKIDEPDGNYTNSKNSRLLHLTFGGETPFAAELMANKKTSIKKEALFGYTPIDILSARDKWTFQRWLSSRYYRSAFPDNFEKILRDKKLDEDIKKTVKPLNELISCVLFDVDNGEEIEHNFSDGDAYSLTIFLLYEVDADQEKAKKAAEEAKKKIHEAFKKKVFNKTTGKWEFIQLLGVEVSSENGITYYQFTLLRPWRLDYISLGADPQQKIPAK